MTERETRRTEDHLERADVLDMFRRHVISTSRAADELGLPILDFLKLAGANGIPAFDMSDAELAAEIEGLRSL